MASRYSSDDGIDYVPCDYCGHPIERHGIHGCREVFDHIPCNCRMRLTKVQIREIRMERGLTGRSSTWRIK